MSSVASNSLKQRSTAFFRNIPNIVYNGQLAKNLILRARFRDVVLNRAVLFYTHTIKDGERPDIIAYEYYEDVDLDWLVLMANEIVDPYFDWPMTHGQMTEHLKRKYGSLSYATQTIAEWHRIVEPRVVNPDGTIVEERTIKIDAATFQATPVSDRRSYTLFDLEMMRNDARREIKILDPQYVGQVLDEIKTIYTRR